MGKTNTQTIGQTNNIAPTTTIRPKGRVDTVDQSTNTEYRQELPTWVWVIAILLFIVGWVTDTPGTMLKNLFRRRTK